MSMMRSSGRLVSSVVAVLVGLLFATGCEEDDDPLGAGYDFGTNDPNMHLAMGDSITQAGWPGILAGKLGKPVANYSQGGARTDTGAGAVNGQLSSRKPGFLLILYGANDAINGASVDNSIANLRSMIVAAKNNQTIPAIGTLTPMTGSHELFAGNARALSQAIRGLASEQGIKCADLEKAFGTNPDYVQADGLHPTPAGSERIAEVFYNVLN